MTGQSRTVSRRSLLAAGGGAMASAGILVGAAGARPAAAETAATIPAATLAQGMAVITLGTAAGPAIRGPRNGIATMVIVDGNLYLVDCGLGTARQATTVGLTLNNLRGIFLTHLHSDHVSELPGLLLYNWGPAVNGIVTPLDIVGPARTRLPRHASASITPPVFGTRRLVQDLLATYSYDVDIRVFDEGRDPLDRLLVPVEIEPPTDVTTNPDTARAPAMDPFVVWRDTHVTVSAVLVNHPPVFPAYAFRFDSRHGSVTISGDTTPHPNTVRLARDTNVLVHEAINVKFYLDRGLPPDYVAHIKNSHTDISEVGAIARDSDCGHLVLSHLGGINTDADAAGVSETYDGPVTVAADRQLFSVG